MGENNPIRFARVDMIELNKQNELSEVHPQMKFLVNIDRDEDGVWVVECPAIPGCVSQGQNKDEALTNIEDAIRICLEVRAEQGLPLTIETHQVEVLA
jgi:predicted RNase H-like HicB family nuclease